MKKYHSNFEQKTEQIATEIAMSTKFGTVIALHGNLGAGKTVFARGFARGLGIKDIVCSPTFTLVKEYSMPDRKWLFHLDLYRIADAESALSFGIEEYMNNENAITLIEWPERITGILKPGTIFVHIERINDHERNIKIS